MHSLLVICSSERDSFVRLYTAAKLQKQGGNDYETSKLKLIFLLAFFLLAFSLDGFALDLDDKLLAAVAAA